MHQSVAAALFERETRFFPICILPQQSGRNKGWTKSGFKAIVVLSTPSVKACLRAVFLFFVCFCFSGNFDGVTLLWFIFLFLEQEIKKQQTVFAHVCYIERSAFAWLKLYLFFLFWNPWNSKECITSIMLCDSCCWWRISKHITLTKTILLYKTQTKALLKYFGLKMKQLGFKCCKMYCLDEYHQWTGDCFCWHQNCLLFF